MFSRAFFCNYSLQFTEVNGKCCNWFGELYAFVLVSQTLWSAKQRWW